VKIRHREFAKQQMLTPDFVGIDFTIEIEVRFDEDLAHRVPRELSVGKPHGLKQNAVRDDDYE